MQGDREVIMIKGKRSKRPRPSSPLALTMLAASSYSVAELGGGAGFGGGGSMSFEFSGSSHNSGELTPSSADEEEEYMANCLILLSGGQSRNSSLPRVAVAELYRCKTCDKSFPSFQALGGHRSSHKKPNNKPMISIEEKQPFSRNKQESTLSLPFSNPAFHSTSPPQNKCRVHECSLCGAEFASGQALGGHMRRHRPIPPPAASSSHGESQEVKRPRNLSSLDLNLPAQEDDREDQPKFPFTTKEEVIIFSTSSLIDCHY
ncbi:zinc finger protein ZAT5-like [Primulina huaijiensis]|uniref:zinc finger protein ZAT5-like n=1 Tax=Primulina huaijiensis TaxID=1492673 RepID=UPI003CC6F20E